MKKVGVVMGSDSDLPVVSKAVETLQDYGVPRLDAHTARILWLPVMATLKPTHSGKYLLWCKFFTCEKK